MISFTIPVELSDNIFLYSTVWTPPLKMLDSNEGDSVSFEHDFNQCASRQVEYKETFVLVASGSSRSTQLDWDQIGSY